MAAKKKKRAKKGKGKPRSKHIPLKVLRNRLPRLINAIRLAEDRGET